MTVENHRLPYAGVAGSGTTTIAPPAAALPSVSCCITQVAGIAATVTSAMLAILTTVKSIFEREIYYAR